MISHYSLDAIGFIETPFMEKFGIPRQPNLCKARGKVRLNPGYNSAESVEGLTQHSHIWLLFLFDQNIDKGWKASVRPPRLGGNSKIGVFATRSTFRPNNIGMSVVKLLNVVISDAGDVIIEVEGVDLVNKTPIIDIKPYIPYSDAVSDAFSDMAPTAPKKTLDVTFSTIALSQLKALNVSDYLTTLIVNVLEQDPRPQYKTHKLDTKIYGITLENVNIEWKVTNKYCEVLNVVVI